MQIKGRDLSLETYFAMAVHDLKTPINAQILATEYLLKNAKLSEDLSGLINDIQGSAKYLKLLVDNLLTKYQIDIQAQNICIKPNLVSEVVEDAFSCVKFLTEEKGVSLIVINKIKTDVQMFDYIEIKRLITNLLVNAIDFTKNKVILKISETEKYIRFSAADYGTGINLENKNDIFSRDLTLSKSQKRLGTGLGLFISKQIAEAHRGKICVKSKIDKGTVISFILPK